jgi:DNA excision repair protein ERCC-2
MNRVVQSAGRIIRSETDRGVVLLLDKRFGYENYSRHFPRDWYETSPAELITKNYRQELAQFWNSEAAPESATQTARKNQ